MKEFLEGRLFAVALFALLAVLSALSLNTFFEAGFCLDYGGSYDYSRGICNMEQNHPYDPSWLQNPWVMGALIGGALLAFVVLLARGRRKQPHGI